MSSVTVEYDPTSGPFMFGPTKRSGTLAAVVENLANYDRSVVRLATGAPRPRMAASRSRFEKDGATDSESRKGV